MRKAAALLAALLAFLPAPALAQQFPLSLPANTCYCRSAIGTGPGQAIPFLQLGKQFIAAAGIASVNFNAANTDTAITISLPPGVTRYIINSIRISGASASISTATVGVFTAAAGAGTAVVTAATAVTVTSAAESTNNNAQSLTVANQNTIIFNNATLYFRVATAQGSAATANVHVYITPLPPP